MMTQVFDTPASLYRALPSVDSLLAADASQALLTQYGKDAVKQVINQQLAAARAVIATEQRLPQWLANSTTTFEYLAQHLQQLHQLSLRPVHNLTGTILHTNLGRSQQSEAAINAVTQVMRHATPLEFELEAGKRGHRDNAVSQLIHRLTGAEACCVVNNNAAAVLLMLSAVCAGKEVIVSRGELVEIGGAFRIPDIMRQAGCTLVEVGATNRTHLRDYQAAITENTGAIMKVHTSNYHIQGFTSAVDEATLGKLCRERGIPLISDLGSGALTDLRRFGLKQEPMPQQMLADGVDLVSFSGDKLLGGPQSGLIVGKQALIDKLQQHPLKRALRCDKLILAALEATLLHYLNPETLDSQLPIMAKFARSEAEICRQAERFVAALQPLFAPRYPLRAVPCQTQVGSGSQPDTYLPSAALAFRAQAGGSLAELERHFKSAEQPIIGRIKDEQLLLDLRGADDFEQLLASLAQLGAPT
ncbi:L-seryl-tRNA(Sec) selenium transferase [Shewanella sp. C32]|uniref:L-seryl-tRNA(Sec) selenium transferase n=1 Tax=Shewanella electrica TaxID=515560 RepID=A0ABT2FMG5_9GAMM|nr:L-seryl-tRNA(Sec) selenium transferase [Shewanella electrica]MCH1926098.1 L-seryl-tRNA(Sec) selenium transferase [Shewanella electrica]MCS4557533.1 L-seryl-tRNA(Sec) selenium transferase [Shewanella electrica]